MSNRLFIVIPVVTSIIALQSSFVLAQVPPDLGISSSSANLTAIDTAMKLDCLCIGEEKTDMGTVTASPNSSDARLEAKERCRDLVLEIYRNVPNIENRYGVSFTSNNYVYECYVNLPARYQFQVDTTQQCLGYSHVRGTTANEDLSVFPWHPHLTSSLGVQCSVR